LYDHGYFLDDEINKTKTKYTPLSGQFQNPGEKSYKGTNKCQ
jgi:hypothetical protein